jgi:hypothetical protein
LTRDARIREAVRVLEAAGEVVAVEGDTSYSEADRREARAERLEIRADRHEATAERAASVSARADAYLDHMRDAIPFGQPILVGHHSERRHRRDLERMGDALRRSVESSREVDRRT